MVRVSGRTQFNAPALIRLLHQLTALEVPASGLTFAEHLSEWLGWTHAISLSGALSGVDAAVGADPAPMPSAPEDLAADEVQRLRTHLLKAFAADNPLPKAPSRTDRGSPSPRVLSILELDFAPFHAHYVDKQHAMESSISALRLRMRSQVAERSEAMGRLAAVDAVMEQVLAPRERSLLAAVPGWLERHFKRLKEAERLDEAQAAHPARQPDSRVRRFCDDLNAVLVAELEVRMQPLEGLLHALRSPIG